MSLHKKIVLENCKKKVLWPKIKTELIHDGVSLFY